jgi:hypothetical protein
MTAGMATSSPKAVVTSASGNAACDCAQTGCLLLGNAFEGVQNAHHRAEQSHEGSRRTDGGQTAQSALQFGVDNGFRAFQSALGGFNGLAGDGARAILVGLELHQASGNNLGQMALLVALGNLDGLVDAAIAQRAPATAGAKARDCLRAALYAMARSIITPIDQPDMMNRMMTTVSR